jgi:predicted enzyme related to lactoylglutathione lyase
MTRSLIINVDVPDLGAAIAFYEAGLGFKLRRKLFAGSVAEMESAFGRLFLLQQPAGSTAVPNTSILRDYSNHWTPVHLDIAVDDLPSAVSRALAAGARVSDSASRHAFGSIARMRDPFGHGFCLIEFSEAGYDAAVTE